MYIGFYSVGGGQIDIGDVIVDDNKNNDETDSWLGAVGDWFSDLLSGILEGLSDVTSGIVDGLASFFGDIVDAVVSLGDKIGEFFSWLLDGLLAVLEGIANTIGAIMDAIINLPAKLIELLGELLESLFVPDDEFFSEKINGFKERFAFVKSVSDIIDKFKDSLTNSEFGTLEVDLGAAEGSIKYGGKVNVLNVSWYSRYKPYGDSVISAFLWVMFILNVYKQLPGIINGASGAAVTVAKNSGNED